MADVITLDLLKRISSELRENSVAPVGDYYLMFPHPDFWREIYFWKPPMRRSASARKRKAARYWRS